MSVRLILATKINFVALDFGLTGRSRLQQGIELRNVPFTSSEFTQCLGSNGGRVNPKCAAEGFARRNDGEVFV
jgi:hypothetical protein